MNVRIPITRPEMGEPEWLAVRAVVESGWVTQGPRVAEFEEAMARQCEARFAVALSSCTAALHLALLCAGVAREHEVIVPSMSFIATANAVVHTGAVPVFAEVDPQSFNLQLEDVEARITERTRAILLVHQLGMPADIDAFTRLARARGLALIEDAACAIGSRYRGRPIGSHGELVCFSFHPRKLVTTGDGGMVTTPSADHARRLRLLRQHAMSIPDTERHAGTRVRRESYLELGYNYRMTDIQAAVGIAQLKRLPGIVARRQRLAARYESILRGHPVIETPVVSRDVEWNVQSYAVRLRGFGAAQRDGVMQSMLDRGIATRPGVMTAHREPAYATHRTASLPISEAASDGSLLLPLYGTLTDEEQDEVAATLAEAVRTIAEG